MSSNQTIHRVDSPHLYHVGRVVGDDHLPGAEADDYMPINDEAFREQLGDLCATTTNDEEQEERRENLIEAIFDAADPAGFFADQLEEQPWYANLFQGLISAEAALSPFNIKQVDEAIQYLHGKPTESAFSSEDITAMTAAIVTRLLDPSSNQKHAQRQEALFNLKKAVRTLFESWGNQIASEIRQV